MVATRGRTFKRPWRRSYHSSKLKSSSAPTGRKDSWCFHAVGSSNAPLLGSTAAEGLPRIGRTSIATRWRSCGLPQSASCSENFVIPPDVFGQTLSFATTLADRLMASGLKFTTHHDELTNTDKYGRVAPLVDRERGIYDASDHIAVLYESRMPRASCKKRMIVNRAEEKRSRLQPAEQASPKRSLRRWSDFAAELDDVQ